VVTSVAEWAAAIWFPGDLIIVGQGDKTKGYPNGQRFVGRVEDLPLDMPPDRSYFCMYASLAHYTREPLRTDMRASRVMWADLDNGQDPFKLPVEPSFIISTSPDHHHVGYLVKFHGMLPLKDVEAWNRGLQHAIGADNGPQANKWMRFPAGTNARHGTEHPVRLIHMRQPYFIPGPLPWKPLHQLDLDGRRFTAVTETEAFNALPEPRRIEPVSNRMRWSLENRHPQRHKAMYSFCDEAAWAGWPVEDAIACWRTSVNYKWEDRDESVAWGLQKFHEAFENALKRGKVTYKPDALNAQVHAEWKAATQSPEDVASTEGGEP
jgi:hypothetical protein